MSSEPSTPLPAATAAAKYEFRERFACKVCSNVPDEDGAIEHGKGCFVASEYGGGTTFVDFKVDNCPDPTELARRLRELVADENRRQWYGAGSEITDAMEEAADTIDRLADGNCEQWRTVGNLTIGVFGDYEIVLCSVGGYMARTHLFRRGHLETSFGFSPTRPHSDEHKAKSVETMRQRWPEALKESEAGK